MDTIKLTRALKSWLAAKLCPSCGKDRNRCWCHST
jgi:hypothetical protein